MLLYLKITYKKDRCPGFQTGSAPNGCRAFKTHLTTQPAKKSSIFHFNAATNQFEPRKTHSITYNIIFRRADVAKRWHDTVGAPPPSNTIKDGRLNLSEIC